MKRIIEHGFKSYMETKCPYCGCRFSFEWDDVISPTMDMYPTWTYNDTPITTNYHHEIFCPECKRIFPILNWSFSYPKGCSNITFDTKTSPSSPYTRCCAKDCTCDKCSDKND